jgi:hypothetical protein
MGEPNCYSILFADRIIREDNGKIGLVGIFEQFMAPSLPFAPLPWGIYIAIDNVDPGKHILTANLAQDETQSVLFPVTLNLEQHGPGPIQIPLAVPPIQFSAYGSYSLTVNLDGSQIGSRILKLLRPETVGGRT